MSCRECGSNCHYSTQYKYWTFVCNKCPGSINDCRRCGKCGRKAYPKPKPVPLEKNPVN